METVAGGLRIADGDDAARAGGVRPGQRLADARALLPDLEAVAWDRAGDDARLLRLAEWATRYTPWTRAETVPPDAAAGAGLLLDISGCAHLFGGERALMEDLVRRLAGLGHGARVAAADTVGVAWAVARHGPERVCVVRPGAGLAAVQRLPVAALRISEDMAEDLARLGLATIGDVLARPRAPLVARFGAVLGARLDALTGVRAEPVDPAPVRVPVRARLLFADPLIALDDILAAIGLAARDLAAELDRRRQGARRLALALYRVDAQVIRIEAGTSRPLKDAARLAGLFRDRLVPAGGLSGADIDIGYGIEGVVLEALGTEALAPAQRRLDPAHPPRQDAAAEELAALIDRLSNRLGPGRVLRFAGAARHVPERAVRLVPALAAPVPEAVPEAGETVRPRGAASRPGAGFAGATMALPPHGDAPLRPIRMLHPPERVEVVAEVPEGAPRQFRWRRVLHTVVRAEGPERLAPEWWTAMDAQALTRDYFRVEDEAGRRFWLFRAGLYGRETAAVQWFMHGIFG